MKTTRFFHLKDFIFFFLVVECSIYLNMRVFVMSTSSCFSWRSPNLLSDVCKNMLKMFTTVELQ